jgi:hypothetical protein
VTSASTLPLPLALDLLERIDELDARLRVLSR